MISKRTRAILTLTGVFALGAIAGAGLFHLYIQGQVRDSQSMNDPGSFRGFIAERLRLTEAQRDSLRDELGSTYDDLAALRVASAEQYNELIDTFSHRVAPQLDADQRQLLGRLEERMRRRLARGAVRAQMRPSIVDSLEEEPGPRNQTPAPRVPVDTVRPPVTRVDPRVVPPTPRTTPPPVGTPQSLAIDSARSLEQAIDADAETGKLKKVIPDADSLRARLALSPEQVASIRQIVRETRQKTRAELKKLDGFRRLQREALRRNLREMDLRIESILDERQRADYHLYRRHLLESRKHGKDARKKGGTGGPGNIQ